MNLASPPPVIVVREVGCDEKIIMWTVHKLASSPPISVVWEVGCDGSKCGQFMNLASPVSVSRGR